MKISLAGKNVLVTGGTRGIGEAITTTCAEAGARVITCHRGGAAAAAQELAVRLKEIGGEHHVTVADVTVPAQVDALMAECRERFGGLDAIVCNAGAISHVPFADLDVTEWRRVIDTNLTGAYLTVSKALPLLRPGSSILFIGSKAAMVGIPLRAHYTAAKAALSGMTRSLAKELGRRSGIRVNVLAPGVIETPETASLPAEQYARYQALTSLNRLGTPAEIAVVAAFLVSDLAGYITGETINVDGGT